jgi:hypothetical protein
MILDGLKNDKKLIHIPHIKNDNLFTFIQLFFYKYFCNTTI